VTQRLVQLRALMNKRKGPKLSTHHVQMVFQALRTTDSDVDIFMAWLGTCVQVAGSHSTLCFASMAAVREIFVTIVCPMLSPKELSMPAWKCFRTWFTLLCHGKEETTGATGATTGATGHGRNMEVGLAVLWDIVLHCLNDEISNQASEALLVVCLKGIETTGGGGKDVVSFLDKIFTTYLEGATGDGSDGGSDKVTLRCLGLLSKYVTTGRATVAAAITTKKKEGTPLPVWNFDQPPKEEDTTRTPWVLPKVNYA
jgi:hypothetical protein